MIINKQPDSLPPNCDANVKYLIEIMMQKDPAKRPYVWEIADIPCVNEKINNFVKQYNCKESVESIYNGLTEKRSNN